MVCEAGRISLQYCYLAFCIFFYFINQAKCLLLKEIFTSTTNKNVWFSTIFPSVTFLIKENLSFKGTTVIQDWV